MSPLVACAVERRRFPVGANPTRRTLQPEATGAAMEVTKWLKPSDSVSRNTVTARGGAKDPDFWCAFEDGEVKVIGDEPCNTDQLVNLAARHGIPTAFPNRESRQSGAYVGQVLKGAKPADLL